MYSLFGEAFQFALELLYALELPVYGSKAHVRHQIYVLQAIQDHLSNPLCSHLVLALPPKSRFQLPNQILWLGSWKRDFGGRASTRWLQRGLERWSWIACRT